MEGQRVSVSLKDIYLFFTARRKYMFLLPRVPKSDISSLSYFFGCGSEGKAIAVDVFLEDVDWFIEQATSKEVEIEYVVDTHIHADHISGGYKLAKRTGGKYCLHQSSMVEFEFTQLSDNDVLTIGNVSVKVLHTPGHTLDSVCLLVSDNRRSTEPWFILTGHTLFVGSVGRPDLKGQEAQMAEYLYNSIIKKILTLPENIEIYPGAQAGSVCGAGLSGKPSSTIYFEKKFNTILNSGKTNFIENILSTLPEKPINTNEIIRHNIGKEKITGLDN